MRLATGFVSGTAGIGPAARRYQVFIPEPWRPDLKWPAVLFLHGAGERGDDGEVQIEVGIGPAIRKHPGRFPCLVVLPQCTTKASWNTPNMQAHALAALEDVVARLNGDEERLYLTGISMGAYGTWDIAARQSGQFAALVPICGGVHRPFGTRSTERIEDQMRKVGRTPVWVFHGGADTVVPVIESRQAVAALQAVGGVVRYTEYPGVGHNSWDRAYAEPELMPWLLGKSRLTADR